MSGKLDSKILCKINNAKTIDDLKELLIDMTNHIRELEDTIETYQLSIRNGQLQYSV